MVPTGAIAPFEIFPYVHQVFLGSRWGRAAISPLGVVDDQILGVRYSLGPSWLPGEPPPLPPGEDILLLLFLSPPDFIFEALAPHTLAKVGHENEPGHARSPDTLSLTSRSTASPPPLDI